MNIKMIPARFENGEYKKWIKEFQQKNPETISFSNRVSALNNIGIKLESLNPLRISAKDISENDFDNLALLPQYYDYIKEKEEIEDGVVVVVDNFAYTLTEDTKSTDKERVIMVILSVKREH